MLNTSIGKYTLTRKIGEGGMASVYEAIHERLGTKVAIKVLSPILARNPQLRQRFENEANFMASLSHPHITRVLDVEEKDETLAIIMELLEGEDLDARVKRTGPLSTAEVKMLFTQVLNAFDYAHSKGIVHRDVKPANIFIDKNNQVKILDFGIAKLFGTGNEMTQTGTQMGTPVYMSPEQVRGEKSIDHRSDIYALGVTLYFTLTGKAPYESAEDSSYEIFTKIINDPIPSLENNSFFNAIIQKAASKDRNVRYQAVDEMRKELDASGNPQPSIHVSETKEETLTQEIKATESQKPVQKEEEEKQKKIAYLNFKTISIAIGIFLFVGILIINLSKNSTADGLVLKVEKPIANLTTQLPKEKENNNEIPTKVIKVEPIIETIKLKIGQKHQGGIIFYLDNSGKHGKVCTERDLGSFDWDSAMKECQNLNLNGYSDWYLPSIDELKLLYNLYPGSQGSPSPGLSTSYWSSSSCDSYFYPDGEWCSSAKYGLGFLHPDDTFRSCITFKKSVRGVSAF